MNKSAQSLLDLFNIMSGEKSFLLQSPVTNKEAQTLYDIWCGDRDEYGRAVMPKNASSTLLKSLADKKLIRMVDMRLANKFQSPAIEITKEGQNIIRDIILHTEKSAYEKGPTKIDYENIYQTSKFGPLKKAKIDKKAYAELCNKMAKFLPPKMMKIASS